MTAEEVAALVSEAQKLEDVKGKVFVVGREFPLPIGDLTPLGHIVVNDLTAKLQLIPARQIRYMEFRMSTRMSRTR